MAAEQAALRISASGRNPNLHPVTVNGCSWPEGAVHVTEIPAK